MRPWAVLVVGLCLAGCANLERFYTPESTQAYSSSANVTVVDAGSDAEAAYAARYQNANFRRIGHVNFAGSKYDDDDFAALGRKVGADIVLVSRRVLEPRVVEDERNAVDPSTSSSYGLNPASGSETGFNHNTITQRPPGTYVVRDWRQTAIYLKRVSG
jgi:hypothetical protein